MLRCALRVSRGPCRTGLRWAVCLGRAGRCSRRPPAVALTAPSPGRVGPASDTHERRWAQAPVISSLLFPASLPRDKRAPPPRARRPSPLAGQELVRTDVWPPAGLGVRCVSSQAEVGSCGRCPGLSSGASWGPRRESRCWRVQFSHLFPVAP